MSSGSPRRRILVLTLALAMALALALAGTASARQVVRTMNNFYSPKSPSVSTGEKVVWKNPSNRDHTVSAYGGNWSKDVRLDPGDRTSMTFNQAGTYKFRCMILGHSNLSGGQCSGMCGRIRVG
jgi:plastocyanin